MRGVSEVIVVVLTLILSVSLAALTFNFLSSLTSGVTSTASSSINTTTTKMLAQLSMESMSDNVLHIRNIGHINASGFSVYIDDTPASFDADPSVLVVGEVGVITIHDSFKKGDMIKITTAQESYIIQTASKTFNSTSSTSQITIFRDYLQEGSSIKVTKVSNIINYVDDASFPPHGGSPENTIVLIDPTLNVSKYIGNYYKNARKIPERNIIYMDPSATNYDNFNSTNIDGLLGTLSNLNISDHIDYIVIASVAPNSAQYYMSSQNTLIIVPLQCAWQ